VTEGSLDGGAQLPKGPVKLRDFEDRIVTEPSAAGGGVGDSAAANSLGFGTNLSLRISEGDPARVLSGSLADWQIAQFLQELLIVGVIVAWTPGVSGGINAGATLEGLDLDAAVVCQDPPPEMLGLLDRFEPRVFGKGGAGLVHLDCIRKIQKRGDSDAQWLQQLGQLAALGTVSGADHQVKGE
jgi:hypothetical protein